MWQPPPEDVSLLDHNSAVTAYRRRSDVQEAPYDGELILYNPKNHHSVSLNLSAAALWEAMTWAQTSWQLAELLHEAEPVHPIEECAQRAETLLSALLSHDLLETLHHPSPLTPPTT